MMLLDIDPNLVKPGWTPLIITVVLAIIMVLLFVSMRRQFRKINVGEPEAPEATQAGGAQSGDAQAPVLPAHRD